jgi:hypothetical protein
MRNPASSCNYFSSSFRWPRAGSDLAMGSSVVALSASRQLARLEKLGEARIDPIAACARNSSIKSSIYPRSSIQGVWALWLALARSPELSPACMTPSNRELGEQGRIRSANRFPGFCAAARLGMQTASSRQYDSATMVSTACGVALAVRRMHFPSTNAAGLSPFGWLRDVRSVLVCHGSVWNYAIVSF